MRQLFFITVLFAFVSCQPDSSNDPIPTGTGINFVGTWNRDSVIVNDIAQSGLKVRTETFANLGTYTFNADKKTGIMTHSGSDFAITWNYNMSANTMMISEIDWENQLYSIKEISVGKVKLTGYLDTGGGNQNERILYLTKK